MRKINVPITGVFLLNKPINITSNQALQKVKRIFHAKKAGHTGSLDPLATGMLPICFGRATKFSRFLINADKVYSVTAILGARTTTLDAQGDIIQEYVTPVFTPTKLNEVMQSFVGDVSQMPPMYSAIKHQGKPLYRFARKGIDIQRPKRTIFIHSIVLLDYDAKASEFSMKVRCSKGTYIRTLVDDIGNALGCGAYVKTLHRHQVGSFDETSMMTLEAIEDHHAASQKQNFHSWLLSIEESLSHLPVQHITLSQANDIRHGRKILLPAQEKPMWLKLLTEANDFLGVCCVGVDGKITDRVLEVGGVKSQN